MKIYKYTMLMFVGVFIMACQGGGAKQPSKNLEKDLYVRAQTYLDSGEIMLARDTLYALKNTHEKYPEAMILLKNKVEPLRLKTLKEKKKEGSEARWQGRWQQALNAYIHASKLALGDDDLEKKIVKMQTKVHQSRFDSLLKKRAAEDKALMKISTSYMTPPKALAKDDAAFGLHQQRTQKKLREHAAAALKQAETFLKKGYPEAAYAEMVSYFHFNPKASDAAIKIFERIKKTMPASIRIPGVKKARANGTKRAPHKAQKPQVTTAMIEAYIRKEEWMKANSAAKLFGQQGGSADEYLTLILEKRTSLAQQAYELGRQAFLQEKLGSAMAHWQVAVHLMPDNNEYRQSLGRATRLQKRLKSLKDN